MLSGNMRHAFDPCRCKQPRSRVDLLGARGGLLYVRVFRECREAFRLHHIPGLLDRRVAEPRGHSEAHARSLGVLGWAGARFRGNSRPVVPRTHKCRYKAVTTGLAAGHNSIDFSR
jgi:hypothetical protein